MRGGRRHELGRLLDAHREIIDQSIKSQIEPNIATWSRLLATVPAVYLCTDIPRNQDAFSRQLHAPEQECTR